MPVVLPLLEVVESEPPDDCGEEELALDDAVDGDRDADHDGDPDGDENAVFSLAGTCGADCAAPFRRRAAGSGSRLKMPHQRFAPRT